MYTKLGYRLSYESTVKGRGVKQSGCRQIIAYWREWIEERGVNEVNELKLKVWEWMR